MFVESEAFLIHQLSYCTSFYIFRTCIFNTHRWFLTSTRRIPSPSASHFSMLPAYAMWHAEWLPATGLVTFEAVNNGSFDLPWQSQECAISSGGWTSQCSCSFRLGPLVLFLRKSQWEDCVGFCGHSAFYIAGFSNRNLVCGCRAPCSQVFGQERALEALHLTTMASRAACIARWTSNSPLVWVAGTKATKPVSGESMEITWFRWNFEFFSVRTRSGLVWALAFRLRKHLSCPQRLDKVPHPQKPRFSEGFFRSFGRGLDTIFGGNACGKTCSWIGARVERPSTPYHPHTSLLLLLLVWYRFWHYAIAVDVGGTLQDLENCLWFCDDSLLFFCFGASNFCRTWARKSSWFIGCRHRCHYDSDYMRRCVHRSYAKFWGTLFKKIHLQWSFLLELCCQPIAPCNCGDSHAFCGGTAIGIVGSLDFALGGFGAGQLCRCCPGISFTFAEDSVAWNQWTSDASKQRSQFEAHLRW